MALFVAFAALMLAVALTLVLRPLLSAHTATDPQLAARRRLQVLEEAHAAGVLNDEEYAVKRKALAAHKPAAGAGPPTRSRTAFYSGAAVALLLPALAIVMYRLVGSPAALDPAAMVAQPAAPDSPEHGQGMDQAITSLAAKLKQNPNDAEGWALLGRAYLETQHFEEARDALKHAHDLVPGDPDVAVAYAEAMTLASESHRFDGEARTLLESALKTDPKNQRGTWLLGIADFQSGQFDAAIASWNRLLTLVPKDSTIERSVKTQIARAEAARDGKPMPDEIAEAPAQPGSATTDNAAAAGMPGASNASAPASAASGTASTSPAGSESTGSGAATAEGPRLTVKVMLDPSLTAKVAPGDTVFVYAKAASGPPMPLAIQRLRANQLPATIELTDGMGMLPSMRLSQFPQIIVGARISKSGNAIAASGDLQTVTGPLASSTKTPISLTINQVVP